MGEFADKYNGDVQACLRGIQKERSGIDTAPIDRTAMKRKWVQEPEMEEGDKAMKNVGNGHDSNPAKAAKNRALLLFIYTVR
jgi:hypothetical protein